MRCGTSVVGPTADIAYSNSPNPSPSYAQRQAAPEPSELAGPWCDGGMTLNASVVVGFLSGPIQPFESSNPLLSESRPIPLRLFQLWRESR
jgi:hypothetical protein